MLRVPKTRTVFAVGMSFWGGEPETAAIRLSSGRHGF